MRETLIAFIESVQKSTADDYSFRPLLSIMLNGGFPALDFGYGYFDQDKVFYRKAENEFEKLPNKEGVDRFIAAIEGDL